MRRFASPPVDISASDLLVECEQQLRPLIDEILQSAVEAGWRKEDVLLSLVDLAWEMYEQERDAPDKAIE